MEPLHLEFSPIKGPEGNIEYLLHLRKGEEGSVFAERPFEIASIVKEAHDTLD